MRAYLWSVATSSNSCIETEFIHTFPLHLLWLPDCDVTSQETVFCMACGLRILRLALLQFRREASLKNGEVDWTVWYFKHTIIWRPTQHCNIVSYRATCCNLHEPSSGTFLQLMYKCFLNCCVGRHIFVCLCYRKKDGIYQHKIA